MKYLAQFTGRTRGAIGIFYPCEVTVEANDTEAARLKLYDTHEHIQGLVLTEKPEPSARQFLRDHIVLKIIGDKDKP